MLDTLNNLINKSKLLVVAVYFINAIFALTYTADALHLLILIALIGATLFYVKYFLQSGNQPLKTNLISLALLFFASHGIWALALMR